MFKFNKVLALFFVVYFSIIVTSFAEGIVKKSYNIQYSEFQGKFVGLEINPNKGRISLYVYTRYGNNYKETISGDDALNFLRNEVLRFVSEDGPVKLGDSDFMIEFQGKHPIWAPHTSFTKLGEIKYLYFAENTRLDGNTIVVQGNDEAGPYDGYKLWKPNLN